MRIARVSFGWLLLLAVLGVSEGCSGSSTGGSCTSNANCQVGTGQVCCSGHCAAAVLCGLCASPTADVDGDWDWRFVCMDASGTCPVRDDTHTITMTQVATAIIDVTVPNSDDIRGTHCNNEINWAETGTGTDNGCWVFDPAVDQFNQRSTADQGQRLCLGVAARSGTTLPTVPDCTTLQNLFNAQGAAGFQVCPPAPPAPPG